jgi:hypothetical protein
MRFSTVPFVNGWRYDSVMKYPPAVQLPSGGTPAERLDLAFRRVLTVSKNELLKREAQSKVRSKKKRTRNKTKH